MEIHKTTLTSNTTLQMLEAHKNNTITLKHYKKHL